MVCQRYEVLNPVDPKALGQHLILPTSKRTVKNRFLRAALSECLATYDPKNLSKMGIPTQRSVNLYERLGHGGYGMVLTGGFAVDHHQMESPGNIVVSKETASEEKLQMLRKISAVIKTEGSLAIAQVNTTGRQTPVSINPHPFAPSAIQLPNSMFGNSFGIPVEITLEQIRTEVVERFVYVAKVLHETGFDGIQIHAAHGYLLSTFLSSSTNKRTDAYGGTAEKRARILADIHDAIRQEIPPETGFIVGIKINSAEFQEDGEGIHQGVTTAKLVDQAGYDFIEFSGGSYEHWELEHKRESTKKREAFFLELVEEVRPHLHKVKVFLSGGFRTVPAMVRAVEAGATDGIGLGRPTTTEPDFAKKVLAAEVQSSVMINDYDFAASWAVSRVQLHQAADIPLANCKGDPAFGIMDCSDERELQSFLRELGPYMAEVMRKLQQENIPIWMDMRYTPKFARQ